MNILSIHTSDEMGLGYHVIRAEQPCSRFQSNLTMCRASYCFLALTPWVVRNLLLCLALEAIRGCDRIVRVID